MLEITSTKLEKNTFLALKTREFFQERDHRLPETLEGTEDEPGEVYDAVGMCPGR